MIRLVMVVINYPGRNNQKPIQYNVTEEEISQVLTKITEMSETHESGFCPGENKLYEELKEGEPEYIKKEKKRLKGRPAYSKRSAISKNSVWAIVWYLEEKKKMVKTKRANGSHSNEITPLDVREQLKMRKSPHWVELRELVDKIDSLKNKFSKGHTNTDVRELILLENDIMKFPIRIEQGLTSQKKDAFFPEAHRNVNALIKDLEEMKGLCKKQYEQMTKLIKYSSLYCLNITENSIRKTREGKQIRFQKRGLKKYP